MKDLIMRTSKKLRDQVRTEANAFFKAKLVLRTLYFWHNIHSYIFAEMDQMFSMCMEHQCILT